MKIAYVKDNMLYRTGDGEIYTYGINDVIEEFVLIAMKDYDLSLPEREEDETDDDYENSCLDDRHDLVYDVASLAKEIFLKTDFNGDKELAFTKNFPEEQFDELLGEITWSKLSNLNL